MLSLLYNKMCKNCWNSYINIHPNTIQLLILDNRYKRSSNWLNKIPKEILKHIFSFFQKSCIYGYDKKIINIPKKINDKIPKFYIIKKNHKRLHIMDILNNEKIPRCVVEMNKFLVSDFIKIYDYQYILEQNTLIYYSHDIKCYLFDILKWRSCTAYLLVQTSNRGIRYLAYLDSTVYHHGGGCGNTSINASNITDPEIKKSFLNEKNINKISKVIDTGYVSILKNIKNNYDQYFGL